jgi:hypothetical protein
MFQSGIYRTLVKNVHMPTQLADSVTAERRLYEIADALSNSSPETIAKPALFRNSHVLIFGKSPVEAHNRYVKHVAGQTALFSQIITRPSDSEINKIFMNADRLWTHSNAKHLQDRVLVVTGQQFSDVPPCLRWQLQSHR